MNANKLAACIDHTILKPEATEDQVHQTATEVRRCRFASLCVAPVWVKQAVQWLEGSGIPVAAVAGFPHGTSKPIIKAIEASNAVKDGALEIDVVCHLPPLAAADLSAIRSELTEVVKACRAARREVIIKAIVESAYLMTLGPAKAEAAIAAACQAVRESGCDYIKTSTGFHPAGGATVEQVRLMAKHAIDIKIKASGGIRDLPTALLMLEAGASRLGLSASVAIIDQLSEV